ncbi:hypothetical protein ACOJIV_22975, partial [Haloarcula sp. AONF1]
MPCHTYKNAETQTETGFQPTDERHSLEVIRNTLSVHPTTARRSPLTGRVTPSPPRDRPRRGGVVPRSSHEVRDAGLLV